MSVGREKKGGKDYQDMSIQEQAKYVEEYQKQQSVIGKLKKRIRELEQIILKGKKVVFEAADRGRSVVTGRANKLRLGFSSLSKKKGGRRRTKKRVIHSWDRAILSKKKHRKGYCKKYYKGKYGINRKGCKKDAKCKYVDMGSGGEWCYTKKRAYKKRS